MNGMGGDDMGGMCWGVEVGECVCVCVFGEGLALTHWGRKRRKPFIWTNYGIVY